VEGESIAINGVCLTATDMTAGAFNVAAVETTLDKTTAGSWRTGTRVNLERALRVGDRLGGHIVQGHVDGVAEVSAVRQQGDALLLDITLWDGADLLCVPQGSITIDGVSLTVHSTPAPRTVSVSIIDYTKRHTTLGDRIAGDRVNIELDVIGKYVRQLAAPWSSASDVLR
jgi:riboflavin synthase